MRGAPILLDFEQKGGALRDKPHTFRPCVVGLDVQLRRQTPNSGDCICPYRVKRFAPHQRDFLRTSDGADEWTSRLENGTRRLEVNRYQVFEICRKQFPYRKLLF